MATPVAPLEEPAQPDATSRQLGEGVVGRAGGDGVAAPGQADPLDVLTHPTTLGGVPAEDRRCDVVGAAILDRGRVLAARRTAPRQAAGRWEFPGGKVEDGETAEGALVREIAEELGCTIAVTGWLDGAAPIGDSHLLTVALARLVAGEPSPREHDAVRWLDADRLDDVDWLDPDRPFLEELRERMGE